jgi:flavin-dependent dehydrogenase
MNPSNQHLTDTDVLVIGAGPAGTIAASIVHQAGYSVRMVEKLEFPRFVIGESLLPRCMEALEQAGFLENVKAAGFQEKFGAKFVKNGKVCDYSFAEQFTNGWTWTWQVPRAEFDKILADTVEKAGVPISYQTTVTAIKFNDDGSSETTVVDAQGVESKIRARFIIDGSGYGRVIPKLFNLEKPSSLPPRKALFTHAVDTRRSLSDEPNRITIIVHKPAVWIWVIPFSSGVTSVGFVGDRSFHDGFPGNDEEQLRAMIASEPAIAERFKDMEFLFPPRILESWSATTDRFYGNGFVLTGNVTEFLDPVFSSGVTLASVSSQLAAGLVIRKLRGEDIDWDKEYMAVMMRGVDTFRTYVNSWYDGTLDTIFFADDQMPEYKRKICSVLAGYVWDENNDFVRDHHTSVNKLARIITLRDQISFQS